MKQLFGYIVEKYINYSIFNGDHSNYDSILWFCALETNLFTFINLHKSLAEMHIGFKVGFAECFLKIIYLPL